MKNRPAKIAAKPAGAAKGGGRGQGNRQPSNGRLGTGHWALGEKNNPRREVVPHTIHAPRPPTKPRGSGRPHETRRDVKKERKKERRKRSSTRDGFHVKNKSSKCLSAGICVCFLQTPLPPCSRGVIEIPNLITVWSRDKIHVQYLSCLADTETRYMYLWVEHPLMSCAAGPATTPNITQKQPVRAARLEKVEYIYSCLFLEEKEICARGPIPNWSLDSWN